ncbi:uncharacterized protein (TIGR02453 family) [Humibacillus xanthopallidus]|uniref:Uncharacterized protein (TIGR02453 family) n=1 Tax=Humibacillus xanthopallidus TaxID=412689 RepID=A0A543PLA5_9MICO|nr:DUF2461 domain-containing protein [Humibacillus xanthopallidus]TQN44846.1 uncharacterized protein (TIGR02453 family) [Humibacillus xanthopallidus]
MDTPAAFAGFPPSALAFYAGLEADNSRDHWQQHRSTYENDVREPMLALLDGLEDEFGEARLFRPNRDVRFSADKSPYKTHQGALVGVGTSLGYYVQLSADGLRAGGGFRVTSPAQTARFRAAVDAPSTGLELEGLLTALRGRGFELLGEAVRTTPRGYAADHPRIETLRHKELMVVRDFGTPAWLHTGQALTRVRDTWRGVRPLVEWLGAHVGTSEPPPATLSR